MSEGYKPRPFGLGAGIGLCDLMDWKQARQVVEARWGKRAGVRVSTYSHVEAKGGVRRPQPLCVVVVGGEDAGAATTWEEAIANAERHQAAGRMIVPARVSPLVRP